MAQFRKKPIVIEAEQWFPYLGEVFGVIYLPKGEVGRLPMVDTLEGWLKVSAGDWIITGVKGEKYPCKPDIFEATYEKV